MGRRGVLLAFALLTALACPGVALGAQDPPDPGQTTTGTYDFNGSAYGYMRYVPTSLPQGRRVPLVVMVHGAQTTALQEIHATGFNRLAERDGFVVLYPDVDPVGANAPGPINQSWKFYDPTTYFRGNGDSAAIAAMTQDTMAKVPIDPERVYVVGTSAGGLMAAVEAAAYSEIFAAAGNVESAAYADGFCFTSGTGIPVEVSAQLAFNQMGPRARVVPTMVMTSDADLAFPQTCGEKALQQGLRMNNLVLSDSQTAPLALTPAGVRHDQVPGGYAYDVSSYRDPDGCLVGEKWLIHGMPHSWPGGPTVDPKYTGYTDRKAPSGAEATWAFIRRYTKSTTALPCAEAPPSAVAQATTPRAGTCVSGRRITVHIRNLRRVRVTLDGRGVGVRRSGRVARAVIDLRGYPRRTVTVRITGRDTRGRRVVQQRRYRTCTPSGRAGRTATR